MTTVKEEPVPISEVSPVSGTVPPTRGSRQPAQGRGQPVQGRGSTRGSTYGAVATEDGLLDGGVPVDEMPLSSLPPMPSRGFGYHTEPILGCCLVTGLCGVLSMMSLHQAIELKDSYTAKACFLLVVIEVLVAIWCVGRLLFMTPPDEIKRSAETCYPMPVEVAEGLRSNKLDSLARTNIDGPAGSDRLGSYCVRCLVWRPPRKSEAGKGHHCNVCQRCVTGFDHHCNMFGRCIVNGNLTTFYLLIAMMPAGIVTSLFPAFVFGGNII